MIAATLIPLVLNIIWTPVIDFLTNDKYGAVNQSTFLVLSFCIPFQFISNIIWSAHFAKNHLRTILKVTTLTFCIVMAGDLLFIPLYGSTGAAAVFLAATIMEYANYMRSSDISTIREAWQSLITCIALAVTSGFGAVYFLDDTAIQLVCALFSFFLLLLATRQLRLDDIVFVNQLIRRKK
jgi:O-antigen/teichoic acid export membrane protein